MNWFLNMKIGKKLLVSFILVALLAGVVGTIGIINLKNIDKKYSNLYLDYGVGIGRLGQLGMDFQNSRATLKEMMLTKDNQEIRTYEDQLKNLDTQLADDSTKFQETINSDATQKDFDALKDALAKYKALSDRAVAMVDAGQSANANDLMHAQGNALAQTASDLVDKIYTSKRNTGQSLSNQYTAQDNQTITVMMTVVGIAMLVAVLLGIYISRLISKPVAQMVEAASQIADGDLNVELAIETKDEIGVLADKFRRMTDNLNDVLGNIQAASEQVASGSRQVSESSVALSQGATEQASSVEQLTASLEEISSQTKLNADNASQANTLAETAKDNAQMGNHRMQSMLKAMEEINTASGNISKIIKVIDEIAFQTNILALNAAVEAARAGQHGKGFAVVAEEVRNLAARSANAAKETTDMIEGSIRKVNDGTKIANETASALHKIVEDVTRVAELVGSISVASNEQAAGVAQINQGIMQVSQVVQTNSATSEETAAASEELSGQAGLLKEQVSRFALRGNGRVSDAEVLSPGVARVLENMSERKRAKGTRGMEAFPQPAAAGAPRIALTDREFGKY